MIVGCREVARGRREGGRGEAGEGNQEKIRKASSAKGVMLRLYQTRKADPTADYDFRPIIMKR